MKSLKILLCLPIIILAFSCAWGPQGPSEPGRPWISDISCPTAIAGGDITKVVFSYQGDQIPAYAEISLYRMSGMGTAQSRAVGPINYLYENRYEVPILLSANPGTWAINFFVVDAKGRFSNEIGCQVAVR